MLKSLFGVEGVPIRSARVEEVRKKKTPSAIHEGFLAIPLKDPYDPSNS